MGSITIIVCVMVAMAGFASRVQANYHVSKVQLSDLDRVVFSACPSNYYNCQCYQQGDRRGALSQRPPSLTNFFTVTNLCGYNQLNHYHNNDGTYSAFVSGGDGKVVATCYGADAGRVTLSCSGRTSPGRVYDYLICYGRPCEPSTISHGSRQQTK